MSRVSASLLICRHTSNPLIPGIWTSRSNRSGCPRRNSFSADSPSPAVITEKPSRDNRPSNADKVDSWSSATKIVSDIQLGLPPHLVANILPQSVSFPISTPVPPLLVTFFYPLYQCFLGICLPFFTFRAIENCPETGTLRPMVIPRKVLVYTRKGCHLCEIVKESLVKLARRGSFVWHEIDVDT